MSNLLEGKSAVVTGGGGLIGKEICLALAREGVKVVVNDFGKISSGTVSNKLPADEVVDEIKRAGGIAVANYDSVADFSAAEHIINKCIEEYGKIDILVNCATGGAQRNPVFWETTKEEWAIGIGINLNGTFNTCRHALAFMVKQNSGRIINFASPAWLGLAPTWQGGAAPSAYYAGKGGVVSLTRGLAIQLELDDYKITCNAIAPIAGPHKHREDLGVFDEGWNKIYQAGLMARPAYEETMNPAGPEHTAPFVLYLATEAAAKINGYVFGTTRGRVALYSEPSEIKGLYTKGVWTLDELVKCMPSTLALDLKKARG